jgi:hypothetical protein
MRRRAQLRQAIAFGLLIGLPAVVAARQGLDARMMLEFRGHVESEHGASCSWGHDHRLCLLVYQTPWSPGPVAPRVELPVPSLLATFALEKTASHAEQVRLQTARSPPLTV